MKLQLSLSARTIEYLVGILATLMIATGLLVYAFQEPQRIVLAQDTQRLSDLDEAMTLYAENCAVCHGLAGEGIGATPALANPALREADAAVMFKTIARGLFNTGMPAWSQEDGGPLSDYQIGQMVALVQYGDWQLTQDRVVNLGLAPLVPFTTEPDSAILESLAGLPGGDVLMEGVTLYAANCVACHGADGLGSALAPALNDPAVREKTEAEVERIIQTGIPSTLMAGWGSVLSTQDVAALTTLIDRWEEIPQGAVPEPDRPVAVTAESLALGEELFTQYCSRCHGPEGQGTQRAPALNVQSFLTDTNDAAMQQIITLGVPDTAMPAWGDRMLESDIQAIVGFIRSWEPTAPEVAQPVRIGGPWWAGQSGSTLPSGGAAGANPAVQQPDQANAVDAAGQASQSPGGGNQAAQGHSAGQEPGAGHETGNGQQPSGNPPWLKELQIPWYEQVDWRAVGLAAGIGGLAFGLGSLAVVKLKRLKV
jgi:mono/diheme cytochrome c family protein